MSNFLHVLHDTVSSFSFSLYRITMFRSLVVVFLGFKFVISYSSKFLRWVGRFLRCYEFYGSSQLFSLGIKDL